MANGALYAIYGETTSNVFNAAQVIEITVQAKAGAAASLNEIEELTLLHYRSPEKNARTTKCFTNSGTENRTARKENAINT